MSLTSQLTEGLTALHGTLPANPHLASLVVAGAGAVALAATWSALNPLRMSADSAPALTPTHLHRQSRNVRDAAAEPLDIPLDVIPKDDGQRTPFDIVGADNIRAVVDQFYSKLCADPDLAEFFHHIDMAGLKRHQALFIGQLWGGPVHFPLERLAEAHQGLGISPEKYWRVVGHLMVTLTHVNVPDWICVFTMTRLYQARNLVIAQRELSADSAAAAEAPAAADDAPAAEA